MKNQESPHNTPILQCILWFICIPQTILLFLNIRSWTLISGEANSEEVNAAIALLSLEVAILSVSFVVYWLYRHRRLANAPLISLLALTVHVGYMLFFMQTIHDVIPNTIQPWILSEGNVGQWNITLFMPGAFIALYTLTKVIFSRLEGAKGRLITFGLTIGMPLAWYLLATLMQPTFLGQYGMVGWIVIGTILVTLFLAAIINAFDNLIHKEFTNNLVEKHYITAILLGLVAPLGGLYLNRTIPFPVDFQSTSVYVLAAMNGFILLLKPGHTNYLSLKYFIRCASFPFILYFFMVFLPFLPLSLLAIIAFGAGFLMLTPLILGLFQFRVTLHEYNIVKNESGRNKALAITFSGLLILPTYFIAEAIMDKKSINNTLSYFYSHEFDTPALSDSQIKRSTRALIQLRDRKADIQLPYISGFYNAVVFGDMVLANSKISRTYKWLTNEELPEHKTDAFWRGDRTRQERTFFRGTLVKPETDVIIENLEKITKNANKSTVRLTLRNQTPNTHSLFVEDMHLPEGIFVTGLRLKIENEWVDGRIFDRKTALWVFQKITEVRRDPAIVYYTSPTTLELRVYPFPENGIREVELDIQYHNKTNATVKIGEKEIDLNPQQNTPSIVTADGTSSINSSLPDLSFQREPYLHFILDFSAGSKLSNSEYVNSITAVSNELGINQAMILAANLSSSNSSTNKLINIENKATLKDRIREIQLPEKGGLWVEQALANEILAINRYLTEETLKRTPIFVIIQGPKTIIDGKIDINDWSWLIPDMKIWHAYQGKKLTSYSAQSGKKLEVHSKNTPIPVIALKQNNNISLFPANTSSIYDVKRDTKFQVFNPSSNSFETAQPTTDTAVPLSNWATYADIWSKWKKLNLQPSDIETQRGSFLQASRNHSLLLPSTSFIVVESDSQWKILERKESQSLNNHSALDFEEEQQTSEPPWWILLSFFLLFIYMKDRRRASIKT